MDLLVWCHYLLHTLEGNPGHLTPSCSLPFQLTGDGQLLLHVPLPWTSLLQAKEQDTVTMDQHLQNCEQFLFILSYFMIITEKSRRGVIESPCLK